MYAAVRQPVALLSVITDEVEHAMWD